MLADAVRPLAKKLVEQQEQQNLQGYNQRYDTAKQAADRMAELQHRDDSKLEVIPDLERGTANSVIHEKAIQPWEVVYQDDLIRLTPEWTEEIAKDATADLEEKLDLLDGNKFDPAQDTNQAHLDEVTRQWQQYEAKLKRDRQLAESNEREKVKKLILPVKQFNQWDSETDEGQRMCASSVHAMALHYLAPGLITQQMLRDTGYSQLDDFYLKELVEANGGNTNDPDFHQRVLEALGFRVQLVKNASWALIDSQLRDGIPVPMVIAHHGHVSKPDISRWHWILCRGIVENPQSKAHIYNDPYGELDVVNGGYRMGNGASMQYSDRNLTPRWQTDGPNQGWAMIIKRPFPKKLKPQEKKPNK